MHYALCDYLVDLVQNSVEANATEVYLYICEDEECFRFSVKDNGKGMSAETQKKALDPFYTEAGKHDARKAGFGLPFLLHATEICEGSFVLESECGKGTTVSASFSRKSVDLPPIGNISETLLLLFNLSETSNLLVQRVHNEQEYAISRSELLDALGDLSSLESLKLAKTYLNSLEDELYCD